MELRRRNQSLIISYLSLRRLIGVLGILLPWICVLGGLLITGGPVLDSISQYYHSHMRDVFVGLLVGVSLFLITYKGPELIDNLVTTLSGLAGLCIPLFPCLPLSGSLEPQGLLLLPPPVSDVFHLITAVIFFVLLAFNSLFLFTLSKEKDTEVTDEKVIRNWVFVGCGLAILLSLLTLLVCFLVMDYQTIVEARLVLIFEAIMLTAFGLSWLVKGETLWQDKPQRAAPQPPVLTQGPVGEKHSASPVVR